MARGLMESYLIDFEYLHAFWSEFAQLVNRIIPILRYVCVKGSISTHGKSFEARPVLVVLCTGASAEEREYRKSVPSFPPRACHHYPQGRKGEENNSPSFFHFIRFPGSPPQKREREDAALSPPPPPPSTFQCKSL